MISLTAMRLGFKKLSVLKLYELLLDRYGFQNWWPVTVKDEEQQLIEIVLGAILTQNTAWKNVEIVIKKFVENDLLSIDKVLNLDFKELSSLIRRAGFPNQKAATIKRVFQFLKQKGVSNLSAMDCDALRRSFLNIKGVGFETADVLCLYAFNKPCFVVDAYTKRLFSRLALLGESFNYNSYEALKLAVEEQARVFETNERVLFFKEFHALIDEHCKRTCKKQPSCNNCFLKHYCKHYSKLYKLKQ